MTPRAYRIATQVFLGANSLFWLPWGLINLINPKSWSGEVIHGLDVYDLSHAVARTEVRAMYGGLQMAIGIFALMGVFSERHRRSVLWFFAIALTGLAGCRFGGMVAEGESTYLSLAVSGGIAEGRYNQAGLAMYELPNMVVAWVLVWLGRRFRPADELQVLRNENHRLREELSTRVAELA
jgi:hypothetical protein